MTLIDKLTAIADAIRGKTGKTEKLTLDQMPLEIAGILSGGGDYTNEQIAALIDGSYSGEFIVPDGTAKIASYALYNLSKLVLSELPESVTEICENAMRSMPGITIKRLPDATKTIRKYGFCYCDGLTEMSIPEGVTIYGQAFYQCNSLGVVTFRGKATSISSSSFSQCKTLITINVPWAEGEVANAPWGATNATINYNYTEDG